MDAALRTERWGHIVLAGHRWGGRAVSKPRGHALRAALVGLAIGVVTGCTAAATTSTTAKPYSMGLSPDAPTAAAGVPPAPVRLLQLNLCNSGIAACYTGRSVAEAATVIRAEAPDLVTLNEICQ